MAFFSWPVCRDTEIDPRPPDKLIESNLASFNAPSRKRNPNGTPIAPSSEFALKPPRVCRKSGSVICAGHGASNDTRLRSHRHRSRPAYQSRVVARARLRESRALARRGAQIRVRLYGAGSACCRR
jgi:hypothetical protein